ncbi:MAG TPA: hypothetical protein VFD82_20695 [Planctomycetota bacterium]|nr:hypothetical protein [Planctomycetota bacterium]
MIGTLQPVRARTRTRLRVKLTIAAITISACLLLVEIGARVATMPQRNGLSRISRIVLLPFRPEPPAPGTSAPGWEGSYIVEDPELGWCVAPNAHGQQARSNAHAARGGPPSGYSRQVPPGKVRVLTFGDSFTHCDDVSDEETWQAQLQPLRGDVEAVNFGVPAFGTDQAFLRWRRESAKLDSTVSLLCIWPEDICRNLSLDGFYLAPMGVSRAKPRFVLTDGRLRVIGLPCMTPEQRRVAIADPLRVELLRSDHWMRADEVEWRAWYHVRTLRLLASTLTMLARRDERMAMYRGTDPTANDITLAICRQFAAEAAVRGTRPVVVLIPMRDLLEEFPGGERCLPLVRQLMAAGIETWDLSPAFASAPDLDMLNQRQQHMTPRGNRRIAELLAERLPAPH